MPSRSSPLEGSANERTPLHVAGSAEGHRQKEHGRDDVASSALFSFFSNLTFAWFSPLLVLGNEKEGGLDPADFSALPLPLDCTTAYCMQEFDARWSAEITKAEQKTAAKVARRKKTGRKPAGDGRNSVASLVDLQEAGENHDVPPFEPVTTDPVIPAEPSLSRALAYAFGLDFIKAGLLKLVHDVLIFVGPYVLNRLIYFLRDETAPLSRGIYLTLAVTVSQLVMSFCLRHYFFHCYLTGLRVRTAVVVAVYRKALKLSSSERQGRSVGEIVNLISTDAQRIQSLMTYLHATWYSFVQIGLALYFLWLQLGPSCLGGVAIIFIMVPITRAVASWMGGLQKWLMKAKDERVELNNECLGSMKIIKMQAWEEPFMERLLRLRDIELSKLYDYVVANSFSIMLWNAVPLLVALATFAAYTLSGHNLDTASALTALALFEILRFPLFMLPQIINRIVEASISIKRVQSFLLSREHTAPGPGFIMDDYGVQLNDATFIWESNKPVFAAANKHRSPKTVLAKALHDARWETALLKAELAEADHRLRELVGDNEQVSGHSIEEQHSSDSLLTLKRIQFTCGRGHLIAVTGSVGQGKSSIINALLGEMQLIHGTLAVKGRLALFPQTPFIFNDTLRANITFGSNGAFDARRYARAIQSTALQPDLDALPGGDMTEIGEKGITLSGGQKARVAMARVVYNSDAEVYLLDDPLAAVDAHVATHLFQECIVKELLFGGDNSSTKRSVILTTNAVQYLNSPAVDRIIVLKEGRIAEEGTYEDLAKDGTLFSSFLSPEGTFEEHAEEHTAQASAPVRVRSEASLSAFADSNEPEVSSILVPKDKVPHSPTRTNGKEPFGVKKSDTTTRTSSVSNDGTTKTTASLMTKEEREIGHVSWDVYLSWAKHAGGVYVFVAIIAAFSCVEGVNVLSKWWLTHWSQNGGGHQSRFLAIYAVINLATVFLTLCRLLLVMFAGLKASESIYNKLLEVVLQGKMEFFDTTPLGRVINRFSKDIYTIDEELVSTLRSYLNSLMSVVSVIVVCSTVTPIFTLCLVPILIFYLLQQRYFTTTYREIKRIDSIFRSPIYAMLGESLDGVVTVRAFRAQNLLTKRLVGMMDMQQHAYYLQCAAQCWLAIRLELAGTLIISFACLCAVLQHPAKGGDESFAGLAGLSISFALSVTQSLNWSVRMSSDLEASFIAVERVNQYTTGVPLEASREQVADKDLGDWPQHGQIVFNRASLRYRKNLPRVLKCINLTIPGGSKIGVVGRTGSGKSTLVVALLRLVELDEGTIEIDGVNISQIGLKTLRSQIAIIPQDPVLFSGTVRSNLDPFGEHEDERLWEVVERVGLIRPMSRTSSTASFSAISPSSTNSIDATTTTTTTALSSGIRSLNSPVAEGGCNLSVGQRQLLVIARALLSCCKIVVMDEATASIDAETDHRIQQVMRTEFRHATVLTIAHRINTIADSDYILGLSDGRVLEFDDPASLLTKGGLYKDLVNSWEKERQ